VRKESRRAEARHVGDRPNGFSHAGSAAARLGRGALCPAAVAPWGARGARLGRVWGAAGCSVVAGPVAPATQPRRTGAFLPMLPQEEREPHGLA
jgi:hypothetical protein